MRIVVKAKSNSKKEQVVKVSQDNLPFINGGDLAVYQVCVRELPMRGKANEAIIRVLANYFDIAPSLVTLVSGSSSKTKVFEINI